jgi:hypothetical protein
MSEAARTTHIPSKQGEVEREERFLSWSPGSNPIPSASPPARPAAARYLGAGGSVGIIATQLAIQ